MWPFSPSRTHRGARAASTRRPSYRPCLEGLEDRCVPSGPGSLDTTFGSGAGHITPSLSPFDDHASAVLIQPWDGKIIVAGSAVATRATSSGTFMSLERYNSNGSLDTSFGHGGEMRTIPDYPNGLIATDVVALYPHSGTANDGKIVEANGSATVVRFNPNGSIDTSFGRNGRVTVNLDGNISGVVIQADGKIVVEGGNQLARYNVNGTLDTTFGSGGTATLSSLASGGSLAALGLQADGKLVVAGTTSSNSWELARFNANGTLDTTFDSAGTVPGTVTTAFAAGSGNLRGLAIYPSTGRDTADYGKIEVVGTINGNPHGANSGQPALARFNADGTPDTTFGQSGQVVTPLPNSGGGPWATAIQADGKVVVAGMLTPVGGGQWDFGLLRYNTNGSLDTTFGNGGIVRTPISTTDSRAYGVAIQADGKIVAAGTASHATPAGSKWNFAVARYQA